MKRGPWLVLSVATSCGPFQGRPSHTRSVPHKLISESPPFSSLSINGVRGSFAGPLVNATYVKLTGNALLVEVQPLTPRKSGSGKLTTPRTNSARITDYPEVRDVVGGSASDLLQKPSPEANPGGNQLCVRGKVPAEYNDSLTIQGCLCNGRWLCSAAQDLRTLSSNCCCRALTQGE